MPSTIPKIKQFPEKQLVGLFKLFHSQHFLLGFRRPRSKSHLGCRLFMLYIMLHINHMVSKDPQPLCSTSNSSSCDREFDPACSWLFLPIVSHSMMPAFGSQWFKLNPGPLVSKSTRFVSQSSLKFEGRAIILSEQISVIIPSTEAKAAVAKTVPWSAHTGSGFTHPTKHTRKIRFKT